MANLKFSSEIVDDVLFRAYELTDGTSDFEDQALVYLNRAYRSIYMGGTEFDIEFNEDWLWLKQQASIIMQPTVKSGTISVTKNSASATFSAAIATDLVGYYFKVDDHADVFNISVHGGATDAVTLDTVYTGDTDATATYRAFKIDYDISSAIKIVAQMRAYQDNQSRVEGTSLDSLERDYPLSDINSGTPKQFAMVDENTVRFSHYGSDNDGFIRLDYTYLQLPDDLTNSGSEEPLIPIQYRHVLADAALFHLLMDKNEENAQTIGFQAKGGIVSMVKENRERLAHFGNPAMILPRANAARQKRVLRTAGGLIIG